MISSKLYDIHQSRERNKAYDLDCVWPKSDSPVTPKSKQIQNHITGEVINDILNAGSIECK